MPEAQLRSHRCPELVVIIVTWPYGLISIRSAIVNGSAATASIHAQLVCLIAEVAGVAGVAGTTGQLGAIGVMAP